MVERGKAPTYQDAVPVESAYPAPAEFVELDEILTRNGTGLYLDGDLVAIEYLAPGEGRW